MSTTSPTSTAQQQQEMWWKLAQNAYQSYQNLLSRMRPGSWNATLGQINRFFPADQGPLYNPNQMRQIAAKDARAVFEPQLRQVKSVYERRGTAGTNAINAYTGALEGRLGNIAGQVQASGNQALGQQAAITGALADFIRGSGTNLAGELQQKLEGVPLTQGQMAETVGVNESLAQGAGAGLATLGSTSLDRMVQENAAANAHAAAMKGLAGLTGAQQLGGFQADLNRQMSEQLGEITARIPQFTYDLYSNLVNQDLQRRQLASTRGQAITDALGDFQQNALNTNMAQGAILNNLLQTATGAAGGLSGDIASMFNATTSAAGADKNDPSTWTDTQLAANLGTQVMEKLGNNPLLFGPDPSNIKQRSYPSPPAALTKPQWNKRMSLLMNEMRRQAAVIRPLPENILRQQAQAVMATLGWTLKRPQPNKPKPPTGGLPPGVQGPVYPSSGHSVPGVEARVGQMGDLGPFGWLADLFGQG